MVTLRITSDAALASAGDALMKGELPRVSDAEPEVIKTIIKLDSRSMVWAHDAVASGIEALAPFVSFVMVFAVLFGAPMFLQIRASDFDGWAGGIVIQLLGWVLMIGTLIGAGLFLKLIVNSYADLHFNRRAQTIYTKEGKLSIHMDWKRIRPFAIPVAGPLPMGGLPLWSLTLLEFSATNPKAWTKQLRVQGLLPDRESCQRVWEAVRRYMEDSPDNLPPFEVVPDPAYSWQVAILDFGPAQVFDAVRTAEDVALGATGRLRRRNWWPPINPMVLFWWTFFWPGPLSDILYQRFRPRAKLPAEWTAEETPLPGEPNPYRTTPTPPDIVAGRRKATWILGLMCGTCIAIGGTFSIFIFGWHVLPSMWELWRPLFSH